MPASNPCATAADANDGPNASPVRRRQKRPKTSPTIGPKVRMHNRDSIVGMSCRSRITPANDRIANEASIVAAPCTETRAAIPNRTSAVQ